MTENDLLYRQIHPGFVHNGRVSSQAFRATPKDERKLSAYDGNKITPAEAWSHYTQSLALRSDGVMGCRSTRVMTWTCPLCPTRSRSRSTC
jgi:hypothetical protein